MPGFIDLSAMDSDREIILLKELGERLQKIRNSRGLSTRELADLAGMGYTNINNIENGKVNPQYTTIVALAEVLQVDPCVLLK